MTLLDGLQARPSRPGRPVAARGKVSKAPSGLDQPLEVTLINLSGSIPYQVPGTNWNARGSTIPSKGDVCVVVFDDDGDAWMPVWEGVTSMPSAEGINTIWTTAGPPGAGLGQDGDYAIDPGAWIIYGPKVGGAWPAGTNIKGPQGSTGLTGPSGSAGSTGPVGPTGDSAYQAWLAAGNVGDVNAFLASLVGPEGPTGPAWTPTPLIFDTWHTVGAAGQPAWNAGWSNLESGVQFRKDPFGHVIIRGAANAPAVGASSSSIAFTLPVGYRPPIMDRFTVLHGSGVAMVRVDTDGSVRLWNTPGATGAGTAGAVYFDPVEFDTDTATQVDAFVGPAGPPGNQGPAGTSPAAYTLDAWHTVGAVGEPTFTNGWVSYGVGAEPQFRKDPLGRVTLRGGVKNGTITTSAFTLPAGYRPAKVAFFPGQDNNVDGIPRYFRVGTDGTVTPSGGTNTWAVIDGIEFDTDTVTTVLAGPKGDTGPQGPAGDAPTSYALDPWHAVGAAGEPAFTNGYSNYSVSGYGGVAFRKMPDGTVRFKGLMAAGTASSTAFTLPVGYRPTRTLVHEVMNSTYGTTRVDVSPAGAVIVYTPGSWVAFDDISFVTEDAPVTQMLAGPQGPAGPAGPAGDAPTLYTLDTWHQVGTAGQPAFTNTWVNYSQTPLRPAQFQKDPMGRVSLRGMISSTAGGSLSAFTLPAGYRPPVNRVFVVEAGSTGLVGRVAVYSDGSVVPTGGTGGVQTYTTLDEIEFDTDTVTTMLAGPRGDPGPSGTTAYNLPTAKAATTGAIDLALAPPATFDGVLPAVGDLILVWLQTIKSQNGLYRYNGPGNQMSRYSEAATGSVLATGCRLYVAQGTLFGQRDFYLRSEVIVGVHDILFSPPRGVTIMDERLGSGPAESTYAPSGAGWTTVTDSNGNPVQYSYTPPVDVMVSAFGSIYVTRSEATYTYFYTQVYLAPADAEGRGQPTYGGILGGMRSDVNPYATITHSMKVKLVAGVTYVFYLRYYSAPTGNSIQRANDYGTYMLLEARVR